jgi:hypothetical protein
MCPKRKKQAFNITGRKTKKIDETSAQNPQKENKTQPRKPKMVPREQPTLPFVLFSKNQKRLDFSTDNNMNTPKTPHQKGKNLAKRKPTPNPALWRTCTRMPRSCAQNNRRNEEHEAPQKREGGQKPSPRAKKTRNPRKHQQPRQEQATESPPKTLDFHLQEAGGHNG